MISTAKKPSVKRRSDSGSPVTNKKFKTDVRAIKVTEKSTEPNKTKLKVKPKGDIKSKPFKTSENVKQKKLGSKSKPLFTAKDKLSSKKQKFAKGNTEVVGEKQKPDWVVIKQEKKQQKVARKEKRHGLEVYELSVKAKALWEKIRTKTISNEKRAPLLEELFQLVKNDVGMLIHSHDLARVIQSLINYGTTDMLKHIVDKLRQCFVKAATSKYGRFCVKIMMKKCSVAQRSLLVKSMLGSVVKLFCHKFSNAIVDVVYTVWANAATRRAMRLEFCGDLGKLVDVPPEKKHFLENLPEDLKPAILAATKLNINKILDKKPLLKSPLVHAVLSDFINACELQDRAEVLEAVHTEVESLLTSSEGQVVAISMLWHGTNKMKKVAVKSVKGKVKQFAQSEFGHSFIMAMFDSVDDTVLLNKVIVAELLEDVDALIKNEYGRRVVLYLVAHRDPAYFHPQQLQLLKQGDAVRNSKKDDKQRLQELLAVISKDLLQKICTEPDAWCEDSSTAMVMLAVLRSAQAGEALELAYKALVNYLLNAASMVTAPGGRIHVTESTGVHMALKKLMIHEKEKAEAGLNTLAKCLIDNLTNEIISFLLGSNRGAFTLVLLLENGDKKSIKILKPKLSDAINMFASNSKKNPGVKVLIAKLEDEIK